MTTVYAPTDDLADLVNVLTNMLEQSTSEPSKPFERRDSRLLIDVDYLLCNPQSAIAEAKLMRAPRILKINEKFVWTGRLERIFKICAQGFGLARVQPKQIQQIIEIVEPLNDVTRERVASHLQKLRAKTLRLYELSDNVQIKDYHCICRSDALLAELSVRWEQQNYSGLSQIEVVQLIHDLAI